jgi:general secretion pathway protein H
VAATRQRESAFEAAKRLRFHSPLASRPSSLAGFTLIEILVVVVILAVIAAALVLSTAGSGRRQLEREGEQVRALIAYACEQAELSGREIGVSVGSEGYQFSQQEQDAWLPLRDGELRPRHWIGGTAATLSRDGARAEVAAAFPEKPQLMCFSSGELTPFRLDLGLGEVPVRVRIEGDPTGAVSLAAVDANAR